MKQNGIQKKEKSESGGLAAGLVGGAIIGGILTYLGIKVLSEEKPQQSVIQQQNHQQNTQQTANHKDDTKRGIADVESLCCPLTQQLFKQAYMLNTCGHSFEKEEIEKWLQNKNSCPACRVECSQENLIKNYTLQDVVDQYRQMQ
ncbi:hypothetical protein pb186bvf_010245 [Paramecium bursaria]